MTISDRELPAERASWKGRPWPWMLVSLAATAAASVCARLPGSDRVSLQVVQAVLLPIGLLAAGVSVWMRCAAKQQASLNDLLPRSRRRALYVLAAIQVGLVLAVTAWVVAKIEGSRDLPGDALGTAVLWLLAVPWSCYSAIQFLRHGGSGAQLIVRFESAVLVSQAGVAAFLASWALYWGADLSEDWDSIRMFLAALAAFAFLAAMLVAAAPPVRRLAVSVLIVVHFAGILSTVLSAPPGPRIVGQAQHWIFRPYLNFMYLINAYRFYSPEPGPASQLWCRIELEDKKGDKHSHWIKLPHMDDGAEPYTMSLQYTRRLLLTEIVARTEPKSAWVVNAIGEVVPAPYILRRDECSTAPVYAGKLGIKPLEYPIKVPMHPDPSLNYLQPTREARLLFSSFARHLLHEEQEKHPDAKATVKIYRVEHRILPAEALALGGDPDDRMLFLPYYVGKFDQDGMLLDPDDPFLYWLLPMVRMDETDMKSPLKCYAFLHAGDVDAWIVEPRPK